MQSDDIDVKFSNNGVTLTLNRVSKVNALSTPMMIRISEVLDQAQAQTCTHILLRSALPRVFCAGADIQEFMQGSDALEQQGEALLNMMQRLATIDIPILAIARGKAAGAGLIMLASADVVIASDDIQWSCPEIEFGMYPTLVHAALAQKLSPAKVAQLCISGLALNAAAGMAEGLVTEVLATDGFDQACETRLDYYVKRPNALRIARAARLATQHADSIANYYRTMSHLMHDNFNHPDVREALSRYAQALSKSSSKKTKP